MSRVWRLVVVLVVAGGPLAVAQAPPAGSAPVADDDAAYELCGRVFPDPHAYWPLPSPLPTQSPWAKGNVACRALTFLGWDETVSGLAYLESKLPGFVEVYDLSDPDGPFARVLDLGAGEGSSAGLPTEGFGRAKSPIVLIRVTDETSADIPIPERDHFAYTLGIHGIERAGVEGGVRAIEDLATWAACESDAAALPTCELNGPIPHPLMETMPERSITAGEALERSSVWFVLANPDGWRRGDLLDGGLFYQRYNGNGMDMNRDWPAVGYTFRPYTPFSEPETRTIGTVLRSVKERWTGGIDLHGQQVDRAFSFTLLGGEERPFDKDRRVLQFTKGAWADAETRLAWSPLIKPNDAPEACVVPGVPPTADPGPGCDPTPRVYGVQWGTVWDTIAYTTTGSNDSWMASELGLGADSIANEMSLSHLSNCGTGNCFLPDIEQLHVDGNKSLIYAMIHYSLVPEDTRFRHDGRAAWLDHDDRVTHPGSPTPATTSDLPPQDPFSTTITVDPLAPATHEFDVLGHRDGVHNGALSVTVTSPNVGGISGGAALTFAVDRFRAEGHGHGDGRWEEANSYFNQSPIYLQAGARIDVNAPEPGRWRVRVEGPGVGPVDADVEFLPEQAWPDPGQLPYDVSNLDFFADLRPFASSLGPVGLDALLSGAATLDGFDSLVIADGAFLPGYRPEPTAPTRETPQDPVATSITMGAPGAGVRTPLTSTFFEFDVEGGHSSLDAAMDAPSTLDPDLYLQRRNDDGSWTGDLAAGETGASFGETLTYADPVAGRYRVEAHNWAGAPGAADLRITFTVPDAPAAPVSDPSAYDDDDQRRLIGLLRSFVEGGGNLVLTDDALRVAELLGVVPEGSVRKETVYAGFVEFSTDGGATSTYDDPLAANVAQPGAAEGPAHRHQMSEPVPVGFAIQDPSGGDASTMPQWVIGRRAFNAAGGRIVGMANGGVTLGELPVGGGQIRVLGSLLPVPTEDYDHPFGLASYGVTYSGYETFRNLLDVASSPAPGPGGPGGPTGADGPATLPATGSSPVGWWAAALIVAALVVPRRLRRRGR